MVKIKEQKSGSSPVTPKGKRPSKGKSITGLQLTKNPENRRKSVGAVLFTPKPEKKVKDQKRKSIAAFPVPQFEEETTNHIGENSQGNTTASIGKTRGKSASFSLKTPQSPKVTQSGGLPNATPKSIKKKKTLKETPSILPHPTPKSAQRAKLDESTPSVNPRTSKKKQSLLINENESLLLNKIKDEQTPSSKKAKVKNGSILLTPSINSKTPKRQPSVLVNKDDSLLPNGIKEEQTKKVKVPKRTPLVLAPKSEPKVKEETSTKAESKKNSANILKKQFKQDADNKKVVLNIADLENKHNILVKDVKLAVNGVTKFVTKNPKVQNQLFDAEIPLFLQINSFKVPNTKGPVKHVFRVPLEHSVLTADSDICLVVPDVKGIPNKELERHQEHYEKLLADKGVKNIKKIITFYEFRTEYETFELKNRLVDLYDMFLVDGKISGKVVHKAGQVFYKKRKVPNPIKLHVTKLADHIETALKKVFFDMHCKSNSCIVQFGHTKMTTQQLIDNVYSVVQFLGTKFPGRMDNIKSLNVYAHRGSSIPIYMSLKNPNEVKVPTLKHQKPKAHKSYAGELTTQYNAEVVVRPSGKVIVKRSRKTSEQVGENEITDEDILRESKQAKEKNKKGKKRKNSENNVEVKIENNNNKKIKKEKTDVKLKKETVKTEISSVKKARKIKKENVKKSKTTPNNLVSKSKTKKTKSKNN